MVWNGKGEDVMEQDIAVLLDALETVCRFYGGEDGPPGGIAWVFGVSDPETVATYDRLRAQYPRGGGDDQ